MCVYFYFICIKRVKIVLQMLLLTTKRDAFCCTDRELWERTSAETERQHFANPKYFRQICVYAINTFILNSFSWIRQRLFFIMSKLKLETEKVSKNWEWILNRFQVIITTFMLSLWPFNLLNRFEDLIEVDWGWIGWEGKGRDQKG